MLALNLSEQQFHGLCIRILSEQLRDVLIGQLLTDVVDRILLEALHLLI
jgi:hypothetical protein